MSEPAPPPVFRAGYRYVVRLMRAVTLEELGAVLKEVALDHGELVAAKLARALDYDRLTDLCRRFLANPADTANDPNRHISPRHLLLLGMDDGLLPAAEQAGRHPDDDAGPVRESTRALHDLGFPCPESPIFTEEVLEAYLAWLGGMPAPSGVD